MPGDYDYGGALGERRALAPGGQFPMPAEMVGKYNFANPWLEDASAGAGIDIAHYWRMLLKHRWIVVASVIGALAVGLGATLLMTPIFHSDATLKIDRESDRIVNVQGVQPREEANDSEEFYQTQYGILKSRTLAVSVVDKLGLAASPDFFKAMGAAMPKMGANASMAERRDAAANIVQHNLTVGPVRGSRLVKIGFNSRSPQTAARLANATGEEFIESNLASRYDASGYARDFLQRMLIDTKAKLEASERAASDYATREGIINVAPTAEGGSSSNGTQSLQVTSLVSLNNALSSARADRIKAEQRYKQSISAEAASLPEVLGNPTIQELVQTRAKAQAEYQDKTKVFKDTFPEMVSLRSRIAELDQQIGTAMSYVQSSLKLNYDVAQSQEKSFEAQVQKAQSATLDMDQRSIELGILQREADTNRSLYDGLLQRYKEIGVTGGIATNNISFVDHAEVPKLPAKPKPLLNMALAGVAGLGLGIGLALLMELTDESIASPEDVETKLGVSLLGSVPKLVKGENPTEMMSDQRSAFSEAYYSIRTALQFSTAQGAPTSLVVTSSRPSEGKSTTASAIAKNFARIGVSVLLVDGDMRNPSLHRVMKTDNSKGFSNVLTGAMTVEEAAIVTDIPGLHFLPCGPLPPNPAELLAGEGLRPFIENALKRYGMVIIDGPPVLGLADAPTLASAVAGTVMVIESRGTRRGLARTAIQRLQLGRARLLGVVLTKFDAKQSAYGYGSGYAYAYDYNYGSKPQLSKS